jgi:DNA-binding SARP family transcriptional activator
MASGRDAPGVLANGSRERAPPVRISLCGGLSVAQAGQRVEGRLPSRQARILFGLLADRRAHPQSRDALVDALWGDAAPPSRDVALRALLSGVRRVLGPDSVPGGRGGVQLMLPEGSWIDVEEAAAAVAAADRALADGEPEIACAAASRADRLLEGEFLAGLTAPWIDERRTELEKLGRRALELEARAELAHGDPAAAEHPARRLVERAPFRESASCLLMEALAAQGNTAEALLVYDRLRTLLREELGTVPSPSAAGLHQRILAGEAATSAAADVAVGHPRSRRSSMRARVIGTALGAAGLVLGGIAVVGGSGAAGRSGSEGSVAGFPRTQEAALSGVGLAFRYPDDWTLRALPPPGDIGVGSGDSFCNVFKTGQRLRAPASRDAMRRYARRALERRGRELRAGHVTLVRGADGAVAEVGERDRVLGRRSAGRIAFVVAGGSVLRVECSSPPSRFPALDRHVFRPLIASLQSERQ